MAMATLGNQQTWVPYETTKDCTLGFCSIFCPQWCYVIFPPPPPPPPIPALDDDEGATAGNSAAFSPLVIAVIGILAAAFLLVSYYTIISKYCTRLDTLRRRTGGEESMRHEAEWQNLSPSDGLDEAVIRKIAVYRYRAGEGVVDGTDCSVCLGEFRADESLRLLPKCSHAFHRQCIDTWLGSHSNCPLCRASIAAAPAPPPPPQEEEPATSDRHEMSVVIIEDGDAGSDVGEEESTREDDGMTIRRGESSMGDGSCVRISVADVLKLSMEGEISAANDSGML